MLHAGFLPEPGDPARKPFLDTLGTVSALAKAKGITVAFETGQETADLLRQTLDDLKCDNLKVNFDPANVILYDMGDPLRAVEILGPDIRSVHVKDAIRTKVPGTWGEEVPLGQGQVNIKAFVHTLKKVGIQALCASSARWASGAAPRRHCARRSRAARLLALIGSIAGIDKFHRPFFKALDFSSQLGILLFLNSARLEMRR